jgi:hypothetical protein
MIATTRINKHMDQNFIQWQPQLLRRVGRMELVTAGGKDGTIPSLSANSSAFKRGTGKCYKQGLPGTAGKQIVLYQLCYAMMIWPFNHPLPKKRSSGSGGLVLISLFT